MATILYYKWNLTQRIQMIWIFLSHEISFPNVGAFKAEIDKSGYWCLFPPDRISFILFKEGEIKINPGAWDVPK